LFVKDPFTGTAPVGHALHSFSPKSSEYTLSPTQPRHASDVIEEADTVDLKNPVLHALQIGSELVVPGTSVKKPASHLVCGLQESVVVVEVETVALNLPSTQAAHTGCAVVVPATAV